MILNKLVICDLDGTLIDSRADLTDSVNLMLRDLSVPPLSLDTVTSYVGNGARKLVERAIGESGNELENALALFKKYYSKNMKNKTCLYPTVSEGLTKLHSADFKLAVISNKPTVNCIEVLEHLGIGHLFDIVYGASDKYALKPDPEAILMAVEKMAATKEGSWIVGDSLMDLEAGRNAGLGCCYAKYGFFKLAPSLFDYSADSFAEIADFVLTYGR